MADSFFWNVTIPFLAYFLVEVTGAQQYAVQGGEITLTPTISGHIEDILWKHNGNKVVVFDGSQNREYGRYKHRINLDWHTGELTISGLTDADSGSYLLEAVINSKIQDSHHDVKIIDVVSHAIIACVVNNTTPENMDRTLLCSADLKPLTQYIWRSPEGSVSPGPELFIPGGENQESENQESVYTCVVKNPLSEKTAEFNLKDCYTEKGLSTSLVVGLSLLFILLLIIALIVGAILYFRKAKEAVARERRADVESQPEKGTVNSMRDMFENMIRKSSAKNTNYKPPCARTDSHPNTETVTESVLDQDEQATTPLLNKSGTMLPHSVDTHAALVQKGNTLDSHENQNPQGEEEEKLGVGEQEKNLPTMANTPFQGAKEITLRTSATPGQVCIPTPLVPEHSQAQLDPYLSGPKQENKPDLDQPSQDTATSTEESNQQDLYTAEKKDENQLTPYTGEPKQETWSGDQRNYAKPEIKKEGERTVHSRPQVQEPDKSTHTGGQPWEPARATSQGNQPGQPARATIQGNQPGEPARGTSQGNHPGKPVRGVETEKWKNEGKAKGEVKKSFKEEKDEKRKEDRDSIMAHKRGMGSNTEDEGNEGEMEEEGEEEKEPDTEKEGDYTNQISTQSDEEMDVTPITDPNEQHITQTTLQGLSSDSTGSIDNQEEMEHETPTPDPNEQHVFHSALQAQSSDSSLGTSKRKGHRESIKKCILL